MTPNAYQCDNCGHHEDSHRGGCIYTSGCDCDGFMPGACPVCAGFGCADCAQDATKVLDAEYPDRLCAWCLYPRSSPECNFGTGHRYQEHFA